MKKILVGIILALSVLLPIQAFATDEIDYKTYYDVESVTVVFNLPNYTVYDQDGNELGTFERNLETITTTSNSGTRVRTVPTTKRGKFSILEKGGYILKLGELNGWALVYNNGEKYWVWGNNLTTDITNCTRVILEEITEPKANVSDYSDDWEYIGSCRISSYCYKCNTPSYSHKSGVSGWPCSEWKTCAMNGIKNGTHIYVDGYGEFVVNDSGPAAMNGGRWVDLFVDSGSCHIWCKRDVWIIN